MPTDPGAQGSVFINGQSSYSGADIKVVVHIYDGGKLANERKNDLEDEIKKMNDRLRAAQSKRTELENRLTSGTTSSSDLKLLNDTNVLVVRTENAVNALIDEYGRISGLAPQFSTKVLAELQTLSISSHREKFPVRSLSTAYPKSFTRGPRTIAGSMIFTVFDTNVLEQFIESHPSDYDAHNPTTSALIDQIPPFDITISFANELGQVSRMGIYGVEFVNEGQTMSIEDLLLENVVQYVARDYDPMRSVSQRKIDENNRLTSQALPLKASALLAENDYQEYKQKLDPFTRFQGRINPFI
jgi:hypothetical protein